MDRWTIWNVLVRELNIWAIRDSFQHKKQTFKHKYIYDWRYLQGSPKKCVWRSTMRQNRLEFNRK